MWFISLWSYDDSDWTCDQIVSLYAGSICLTGSKAISQSEIMLKYVFMTNIDLTKNWLALISMCVFYGFFTRCSQSNRNHWPSGWVMTCSMLFHHVPFGEDVHQKDDRLTLLVFLMINTFQRILRRATIMWNMTETDLRGQTNGNILFSIKKRPVGITNPLAKSTWLRHQTEIFSALLTLCDGNSPVTCEFRLQRPVTRGFDVFFALRLNKRLSKP